MSFHIFRCNIFARVKILVFNSWCFCVIGSSPLGTVDVSPLTVIPGFFVSASLNVYYFDFFPLYIISMSRTPLFLNFSDAEKSLNTKSVQLYYFANKLGSKGEFRNNVWLPIAIRYIVLHEFPLFELISWTISIPRLVFQGF